MIDPDGKKILYEYDSNGDLKKVTLQSGIKSTYNYLTKPAHYLDEGFDDLGNRDFKVTYDTENRFKAIIDGLGNIISQQNYDQLASNRAEVLDANGNLTKLLYDARGNVLEEIDAAGNKTIREYKDPNNPDLETKIVDRRGMLPNVNMTLVGTSERSSNAVIKTRLHHSERNRIYVQCKQSSHE